MQINTKNYQTSNGMVEGIQVKWSGFNLLLAAGSKGFLACPVIDVDACQRYGVAAALVESTPDNPIGTLERFSDRNVIKVNKIAEKLGIKEGMPVESALNIIA
jgi:uncharacterized protein YunC (DUF1805 family)